VSGDGIRPYAGEFLVSPAGLELSMNWCGHACTYCFANWFKPDRRADIRGIVGLLAEHHKRRSREARLLQARVPMLVSNHVDPFAGTNAVQFEPIWEMCVELSIPLAWQTRGAHKAHRPILERVVRETPRSVWYISIPMLDDDVRRQVEPHAPSIGSRLELVQQLIEAGHVVTVGVNPLTVDWLPKFEPLLDQLKAAGVWGVWIQVPYFSKSFKGNLDDKARSRLGEQFIRTCGEKGSKADKAHAAAAMAYAKGIGLEVFSTEYEEPTRFFDPWHEVYERPMPYWHQLVNEIDPGLDDADEDEYLVITREHAQSILSPLPELDWSEPLRHKRAKHYRAIVTPLPDGRLPKQTANSFWDIMWNDDLFCKSLGPTSFRRFAHASIVEDDTIIPLLDENGDRLIVYRRQGWRYTFAETPELA
jgi:DNA repair photolyase